MHIYGYLFLGIVLLLGATLYAHETSNNLHSSEMIEKLVKQNKGYFKSIKINPSSNVAYFYKNITSHNYNEFGLDDVYKIKYDNYGSFMDFLNKLYDNKPIPVDYKKSTSITTTVITFVGTLVILLILFRFLIGLINISMSGYSAAGASNFQITNTHTVLFDEVIGLSSVKKELLEYVKFMKFRNIYLASGFSIPKGLLFVGSPGTGKTHLAKAFAKESGARFVSVGGSDFIEIYVGVGPKRVRELFKLARQDNKPCVIFIDEIDAIGRKRTSYDGSSTEQSSTLNALLVEMDGFSTTDNILLIASTNMPDVLDPALTRSGRFDKQIVFDPPNIEERKDMFKLYLDKVKISSILKNDLDTQLVEVSKMTAGLTGADIKNIVNQSVYNFLTILSDEEKSKIKADDDQGVTYENLLKSIDEVVIGMEKPERKMTKEEIKRVSYHEAGHTLVSYLLDTTTPPLKTSIIPRGLNALGFTQQEPVDKKLYTYPEIIGEICVLFGGRACEECILGTVSTGASDDFKRIDNLIEHLIKSCRFEELGFINSIKYDSAGEQSCNTETYRLVRSLLTTLYGATKKMLYKHQSYIHDLANYLQEHEVITSTDINRILKPELRGSISSDKLFS